MRPMEIIRMNGHIIQGTNICVDYWIGTPPKKYVHFLTHLHADHTRGLTSTFRELIYTSPFNGWLLQRWFNVDPDLVVTLAVGDNHIVYDETSNEYFVVNLIDANHCPGSVMFLFQGSFGNILYTGDFRYNERMLKTPMLKSLAENEMLHRLYLDNTFAAEHCEFPPRQQVVEDIIRLIKDHPSHFVLIGVRRLGKEEVLEEIAMALQEKICVPWERFAILSFLQFRNVFTIHPEESRIHVQQMSRINSTYIGSLQKERGPVLTIVLTGLSIATPAGEEATTKLEKTLNVHYMPYSDHSCHSELKKFVYNVKPLTIYPIVLETRLASLAEQKSDLSCFVKTMEFGKNFVIPQSILKYCRKPPSADNTDPNKSGFYNSKENLKVPNSINQKDFEKTHNEFAVFSEDTEDNSQVNSQVVRHVQNVLKEKTQVNSVSQFTEDESEANSQKQENVHMKESLVTSQKQSETPSSSKQVKILSATKKTPSPSERVKIMSATKKTPRPNEQEKILSATKKTPSPSEKVKILSATKKTPRPSEQVKILSATKKTPRPNEQEKILSATKKTPSPSEQVKILSATKKTPRPSEQVKILSATKKSLSSNVKVCSKTNIEREPKKEQKSNHLSEKSTTNRMECDAPKENSTSIVGESVLSEDEYYTMSDGELDPTEHTTAHSRLSEESARKRRVTAAEGNPSKKRRINPDEMQVSSSNSTDQISRPTKSGFKTKYFHTSGEVSEEERCDRHNTSSVSEQVKILSATKKTLSSNVKVSSKTNTEREPKKERKSNHLSEKSTTNRMECDAPNENSPSIVNGESILSEGEYYTMSDGELDPTEHTTAHSRLSEESARKRRVTAAEGNPSKKRRINPDEMQVSSSNSTDQICRPTTSGFKTKYSHTSGEVSEKERCDRHDTSSVCLCDSSPSMSATLSEYVLSNCGENRKPVSSFTSGLENISIRNKSKYFDNFIENFTTYYESWKLNYITDPVTGEYRIRTPSEMWITKQ